MAERNDDIVRKDTFTQSYLAADRINQLCLYYVRIHNTDDNLTLQADFQDGILFPFEQQRQLVYHGHSSPFIYTLDLQLKKETNGKLNVYHDDRWKSIDRFEIQGLGPSVIKIGRTIFSEKKNQGHTIDDYFESKHYFLFDVQFDSKLARNFSGLNNNAFVNCCLYICYLLSEQTYDLLNLLIDQFQAFVTAKTNYDKKFDFYDFLYYCNRYLVTIFNQCVAKHLPIRTILRMMGHLPISSFDRSNKDAIDFARSIMVEVRKNFNMLYQSVSENEQLSFTNGLIVLLCIELLYSERPNSIENEVTFLQKMNDEKACQNIADKLLHQLQRLSFPINGNPNWAEIFTMVDPAKIKMEYLDLTDSLETFTQCISNISKVLVDCSHFREGIAGYFEKRIDEGHIQVDLDGILSLLMFLEEKAADENGVNYNLVMIVQSAIVRTETLTQKITKYLQRLKLTSENMERVSQVLILASKHRLIHEKEIFKILKRTLIRNQTIDYYINWIEYFLAQNELWQNTDLKHRKQFFEDWTGSIIYNRDNLCHILRNIDRLISTLEKRLTNNNFRIFVVDSLVQGCFATDEVYIIIESNLLYVQNEFFCERFQRLYDKSCIVNTKPKLFKAISDKENPLSELIKLNQKSKHKSKLVHGLIKSVCDQIELTEHDLLDAIFNGPTRETFVYTVLFEDSFVGIPIRKNLIDRLISMWEAWGENGCRVAETQSWNRLKNEQRQIVYDIWERTAEITNRTIPFKTFINEANAKVQTMVKTIENIKICIQYYCQNCCDIRVYLDLIESSYEQITRQNVGTFNLPDELRQVEHYASYLNTVVNSYTWKNFLQAEIENTDLKDDFLFLTDANNTDIVEHTALEILRILSEIYDKFFQYLIHISTDQEQPLLPQLKHLFPDKQQIDAELIVMKSILFDIKIARLEPLLNYWKNQEEIIAFCQECINLCAKYHIEIRGNLCALQNILKIDEETSSETCLTVYQQYCKYYSSKHSPSIIKLLSRWHSSYEFLQFLHQFPVADIDDLLEVLNNWDEASINTKLVLDFVMLKRFSITLNAEIESIRTKRTLTLDDIITCFENMISRKENDDILPGFESCSKNLMTIQRLQMESKNKEQSKKKRILDIIHDSKFSFSLVKSKGTISMYNYELHVRVIISTQEQSISFIELNDLRDRAKLIQHAQAGNNNLQNYTETNIKQLQCFVSLVDTIEDILHNLNSLYTASYPVAEQYLMADNSYACTAGEYTTLEQFNQILLVEFDKWEKELYSRYRECLNLTYLSYEQVGMIEKAVRRGTIVQTTDFSHHLLKFIGVDPAFIQPPLFSVKSKDPSDLLTKVAAILQSRDNARKIPQQEDQIMNEKILLVTTPNSGILRAILSLFHLDDVALPVANQLFYCTRYTSRVEIRAFAYRCFYSQDLHQLIRPELLSVTMQDEFAQLFNKFTEQSPDHFFRLGIITTVPRSHLYIINRLTAQRYIKSIRDQDLLSENDFRVIVCKLIADRCILVTSRISGLGKSTYIRNQIRRLNKTLVKFPITGNVNIDSLMNRLRNDQIQSTPSRVALHISIGSVENVEQLNEFLYSLILFRCFRLSQTPIHVPVEIPIFIELDSSTFLENMFKDIVIFHYVQRTHISSMDWEWLEIDSSIIQFVVNYLQAIDDKTIAIREIDASTKDILNKSKCAALLQKYFLANKNSKFISWTQLFIFISVYHTLFSGFSKCGYFVVSDPQNPSSLRQDILNSLLNSCAQFTSLSVEKVFQSQQSTNDNENVPSLSDAIIRWDKTQPFTVIFTDSYDPLFVYKKREDIPPSLINAFRLFYQACNASSSVRERLKRPFTILFGRSISTSRVGQATMLTAEQQLQEFLVDPKQLTHEDFFIRLTSLSTKYFAQRSICLKCFKQYDYMDQQCKTCREEYFLIQPKATGKDEDMRDFQRLIAVKLQSQYILTPDNYIKMLLIYLRVQSNIPVLIMGETGCGKTALIEFLCQKLLDDVMLVFRIHAGITNEHIVDQMCEFSSKARELLKSDEKKRVWVFFDEFNTTSSIGLLKEIICEKTLLGESLPENMVFLGACNPQRRQTNKIESDDNIGIKKYYSDIQRRIRGASSSLLYSVVPIPETMLEYVWDYGHLDETTEKTYIETILQRCRLPNGKNNWLQCLVRLICKSQKYIRESEDVSSVSLRDVSRFCRFYDWFCKLSNSKKESKDSTLDAFDVPERASLLALFLCYYFRLNSSTQRTEYLQIVANCITESGWKQSFDHLEKFLEDEKNNLVKRMEMPPGTAQNRALTDNIFVLFTCILNRVPLILCGKPGCSKTSAVQIVISNLRGKNSKDPLFCTYPELIAVSYQGSQNCTSESIVKVFEHADKYVYSKKRIELLPVIVFDEIGLAEISPHNPLKVLHSQLEIEKCRHAFVGLSNWRLDASKMNRAVYLACPELNSEDLKITARSLSESMVKDSYQRNPLNSKEIESLARVYMEACNSLTKHKNQQYFGLRDYYSLIKGIVRNLLQKESSERDLYQVVRHHLSCNFDGIIDGSKFMWCKFCEYMGENNKMAQYPPPTFDQLLDHSLTSRSGRFLMLIGDNDNAFNYIQRYVAIKHPSIKTRTLIGSTLEGDFESSTTYNEQYNSRVLMDIILYAEKEITLFFRGLGHLYDNLYDLFNQSFAVSEKKKYCRIALGSLYHPRCLVNDKFYCIVFVKQQDLAKYDAPFLNRFEKHRIDINSLIDEQHQRILSSLDSWINESLSSNKVTNAKDLFFWCKREYMLSLVTEAFDYLRRSNNSTDNHDVINYCQDHLLRISSCDLPLLLSLESKADDQQIIKRYYKIHTNLSFASFVNEEFRQRKTSKLLIYTYTQIYQNINFVGIDDHQKWIEEIKLSYFRTELELMKKLKIYNSSESLGLLCIRVDCHREQQHIPMLKHVLLNQEANKENRGICLIFHLQRCELSQSNNNVYFDGWSQIMIDDLDSYQLIPQIILMNPSYGQLITHLEFFNIEETFDELISACLIKLRYTVTNPEDEVKINDRRSEIIKQFTSKSVSNEETGLSLRSLLKKHLTDMVVNMTSNPRQTQFNDWREDLLTNGIITGSCRSFNDAVMKTILNFLDSYLLMLFIHLEKYSFMDSYLFLLRSSQQMTKKLCPIWSDLWNLTIKNIDMSMINENHADIPLVFDLRLPYAMMEYEVICQIRQAVAQTRDDENKNENLTNIAYNQLISKSIYRQLIHEIIQDPDLFNHYYHDQLTLTRNEGNIRSLSTSFVRCLLTSKISETAKDRLQPLLADSGELFDLMKAFEIGKSLVGDEDTVLKQLDHQFIIENDDEPTSASQNTNLYRLLIKETNFYLVAPGSLTEVIFESQADRFLEVSLMNLIELLISSPIINCAHSIDQLITTYNQFGQCINRIIYYDNYTVKNFKNFNSILRLVLCISSLFAGEKTKALDVFKHACIYNKNSDLSVSRDQIDHLINYLRNIINQEQTSVDKKIANDILTRFENELMAKWFSENQKQCRDILEFINRSNEDLWAYSAKTFSLIDESLNLSLKIQENNGGVLKNRKYDEMNQYLSQSDDLKRRMDVLISMYVYVKLVFHKNYRSLIGTIEKHSKITKVLKEKFNSFEDRIKHIDAIPDDQKLELIGSIAWLRYYLLHYIYALKNDCKDDVMENINGILEKNTSPFCSTVKLYIVKQLCQSENMTFSDFCRSYSNRIVRWIQSMIIQLPNSVLSTARRKVILPLPLCGLATEFHRIDGELSNTGDASGMRELIHQCAGKRDTAYCFLIWFIHHYTRFYMSTVSSDKSRIALIQSTEMKEDLTNCFGKIGYKFICCLCTNFDKESYFHLNPSFSEEDFHQRLAVLNVIAVLISFKLTPNISPFCFLLFEKNSQIPDNYTDHFRKLSSLVGVALANDPARQQMIYVQTRLHDENKSKLDIFRCSTECSWLFCIENSVMQNEHKQCPLCKTSTSISQNENLFVINQPHISMNERQALDFITEYDNQNKSSTSSLLEKPAHLDQSLTYHFINFLTNAIFLFLHETDHIPVSTSTIRHSLRKNIKTIYSLLRKHLSGARQYYLWLYQLCNSMMDTNVEIEDDLQSPHGVIEFEKSIEEKLILPNIVSVTAKIREYKSFYVDFIHGTEKIKQMSNFVEELLEDNEHYPLLHFFNVTNIHSINIIEHFQCQLQLQAHYEKTYPITVHFLKHLSNYDNIRHLHPLIKFTKYLIQTFNYRIERETAKRTNVSEFLKNHPDIEPIYDQFQKAWFQINLKEVSFNNRQYAFQRSQTVLNFKDETNMSMFLLNKSNMNDCILPLACLQTFANFQNEIIDCFHLHIVNDDKQYHVIPLQSIQRKHLLHFDSNRLRQTLFENALMINYKYGMSEEIIYDFNEIESILRNEISCLPKIDVKAIRYFNYQFELYEENLSLINDIRGRFPQKFFDDQKRAETKRMIDSFDNTSNLKLSGSLEYILTYLRNVNNHSIIENFTIGKFINECIQSSACIIDDLIKRLLASIGLEYMIDLYELNEECIFDKIIAKNMRNELSEKAFSMSERTAVSRELIETIQCSETLAEPLKNLDIWIGMFKRLLVRLLLPKMHINFESSLNNYIKRSDMWKGNISEKDIGTIEMKDEIRLKYAFVILKDLETKLNKKNITDSESDDDDDNDDDDDDDDREPRYGGMLTTSGRKRKPTNDSRSRRRRSRS